LHFDVFIGTQLLKLEPKLLTKLYVPSPAAVENYDGQDTAQALWLGLELVCDS
jgi:hypothetical protein